MKLKVEKYDYTRNVNADKSKSIIPNLTAEN